MNRCPACGSDEMIVGEARNSRGHVIYPYYCSRCGEVTQQYASKKLARSLGYVPVRVMTKTERKEASGWINPGS